MITIFRVVALAALTGLLVVPPASAQETVDPGPVDTGPRNPQLDEAHHLFYSGRYEASAALALEIRTADSGNLDASELRTSALHFQIRRALGEPKDRDKAWKACVRLPGVDASLSRGARRRTGRSAGETHAEPRR